MSFDRVRALLPLIAFVAAACRDAPPVTPPPPEGPSLELVTGALRSGSLGQEYRAVIDTKGGSLEAYVWSTEGALPPGLTISSTGTPGNTLHGTPAEVGTYSFTVRVRDSKNSSAARMYSVEIEPELFPPLVVVTSTLPVGTTGMVYTATLSASGGSSELYTWSIGQGAPPAGLTLSAGGILAGTPSEVGMFSFVAEVRDEAGGFGQRELSVEIAATVPRLEVDTTTLPPGAEGTPYRATLAAHGGVPPYIWSIGDRQLPTGLTLSGDTISGTPVTPGSVLLIVSVRDARGVSEYALLDLLIYSRLRITMAALPAGVIGEPYQVSVEATGGSRVDYTWSIVQGSPPPGLTVTGAGTPETSIAGTPSAAGVFGFTLRVEDSLGIRAEQAMSIEIEIPPDPLLMLTAAVGTATVGAPYVASVAAAGGVPPYNWLVTVGALPPGLSLEPVGTPSALVTGTPVLAGSWDATITVFDSANVTASQTYTFEVVPAGTPLTIATTTLPNAITGDPYAMTISGFGGSGSGFSWAINGAPPGLSIIASGTPDTTISGTFTIPGSYPFTVTLTDDEQNTTTRSLTLAVNDVVSLARNLLPAAELGVGYSRIVTASDGSGSGYTWTVSRGALPPGLALSNNGISTNINGTPAQPGSFWFELTVGDSTGRTASRPFNLRVTGPQRYAVWGGDSEVDQNFALYVSNLSGAAPAAPQRISPANPGFAGISQAARDLKLSPANERAAFIGDFATDEVLELYVVDLTGPAPGSADRANGALAAGGDVAEFIWSPDGERLLYRADQDVDGRSELYLVDVGSGVPGPSLKVNGALQAAGNVEAGGFMFSPDGSTVVYLADQTLDEQREFFAVDVTGTTPGPSRRVNFQLPNTIGDVLENLDFSPDSRVFYLADQLGTGAIEVWMADVVSALPPAPARVNGLMVPNGDVSTQLPGAVAVSPDGAFVAYIADQEMNDVPELYLVDIRVFPPGASIKLNPDYALSRGVASFVFSPDGSRIIYAADQDTNDVFELYYVDIGGPLPAAPVKINGLFQPAGDVSWPNEMRFSPDGTLFGYLADATVDGWQELFLVNASGALPGSSISVLPTSSGQSPHTFEFSPDSTRAAVANERLWVSELSASGVPGAPLAVTPVTTGGLAVSSFAWLRDSQRLFVYGDLRSNEDFEVYLAHAVSGVMTPIHPHPPPGGDVLVLLVPPF